MTGSFQSEDFLQLSAIYGLLSRLWVREVDEAMLEALSDANFKSAFEKLGGHVPQDATPETIESLAVDYCQLLVGPQGHVSPVQSIWMDAKYQSGCTAQVQRYYELIPEFAPPSNIPDHFGNQLQFMAEVFLRSADSAGESPFEEIASRFFQEHLTWAIPLTERVQDQANTDFYRGLASMTQTLLESES